MVRRLLPSLRLAPHAAIFALALFFPFMTDAATCCRCQHPKVTSGDICITDQTLDCSSLTNSPNPDLKGANCTADPATAHCAKVPKGVCVNEPAKPLAFKLSSVAGQSSATNTKPNTVRDPINVNFNVDIPGMHLDQPSIQGGTIVIPFLAQYVAAIQKFAIGIGLIAAAIMITWGGFKYIVSGTGAGMQDGKQVITDALIGLVILIASYLILYNVNPNTAITQSLSMPYVEPISMAELGNYNPNESPPNGSVQNAGPNGAAIADDLPTPKQVVNGILWGAAEAGVDGCTLLAICQHETGFRFLWTGAFNPKTTRENKGSYGGCGVMIANISRDDGTYTKEMRAKFPDFPPVGASKEERRDWMLHNVNGSGYLAASILKRCAKSSPTVTGQLGCYSSGGTSMSLWLKAHPECAKVHAKYKSFQEAARNKDEITKCLPVMVGIPKVTCSPTNKNDCKIDESQACPEDGYECKNAKANNRSEFWGTCTDGTKCLAMKLTDFIPYVISQYGAMKAFGCKPL